MTSITAFSLTINNNSQQQGPYTVGDVKSDSGMVGQFNAFLANFTDSNDSTSASSVGANTLNDPAAQFISQLLAMLESMQQDTTSNHRHHYRSPEQALAQPDAPSAPADAVSAVSTGAVASI